MSHRDHAEGAAERGNDWLDGALAGWLLFIAISAGQLAWFAIRDGDGMGAVALDVAAPVLALAAIFPLLRFLRIGWALAFATLAMMAVREGTLLASRPAAWQSTAAFFAVNVLGMIYLLWIVPEFWHRHGEEDAESAAGIATGSADFSVSTGSARPAAAAPAGPTPVMHALAAIHQRIVAAGSACAVTPVSVRAEAGRFGVTPAALQTEGLALYRTFLTHFLADGPLSADEERELICLERALDLNDDGVWRLRGEAGLRGGYTPAPQYSSLPPQPSAMDAGDGDDALPPAASGADANPRLAAGDADDAIDAADADLLDGSPLRAGFADAPDPSDAAGIAFSGPGIDPPDAVRPESSHDGEPPAAGLDALAVHHVAGHAGPAASADSAVHASAGTTAPPDLPADVVDSAGVVDSVAAGESIPAGPTFDAGGAAGSDALADYEEHELGQLLRWAGIPFVPADSAPRAVLERLRALHRTSTEPLDAHASDYPLEPGERCLAIRTVDLYRVPGAAPATPAADIPAPVLDRRALVGSDLEHDRDLAGLQRTGACRFVLTGRRLVLVAPSGEQSALLVSRLRAVRPYRNGLEVQPQRGNPVFLAFGDGVDDVAMRIDRAAADLRASA